MVTEYFSDSSFRNEAVERSFSSDFPGPNLFVLPTKTKDECLGNQSESYATMLDKLRDRVCIPFLHIPIMRVAREFPNIGFVNMIQVLSMSRPSFSRTVSEREWLRNSAKIWELVKNSAVIAEYSKALQSSGLFRR